MQRNLVLLIVGDIRSDNTPSKIDNFCEDKFVTIIPTLTGLNDGDYVTVTICQLHPGLYPVFLYLTHFSSKFTKLNLL